MDKIITNPWAIGLGVSLLGATLLKKHFNGGWNYNNPSLSGKVIVITGGNTGLGFEAATKFASLNPKAIILACRDETRGQAAVDRIKQ
jgi:FlaA1/EpsC-like NDP-sugar epimerase